MSLKHYLSYTSFIRRNIAEIDRKDPLKHQNSKFYFSSISIQWIYKGPRICPEAVIKKHPNKQTLLSYLMSCIQFYVSVASDEGSGDILCFIVYSVKLYINIYMILVTIISTSLNSKLFELKVSSQRLVPNVAQQMRDTEWWSV